jgi:hypothetical protein
MKLSLNYLPLARRLRRMRSPSPGFRTVVSRSRFYPIDEVPLNRAQLEFIGSLAVETMDDLTHLALAVTEALATPVSRPQAESLHWFGRRAHDLDQVEPYRVTVEFIPSGDIWARQDTDFTVLHCAEERLWRRPGPNPVAFPTLAEAIVLRRTYHPAA